MHEYSIIQNLIELIEKHAHASQAKKIITVKVQIGKLSGVEPHLLEIAFHTFKENTVAADAKFVMDIRGIKIKCNQCKTERILNEMNATCISCGSLETQVLEGEELYLQSLEMDV